MIKTIAGFIFSDPEIFDDALVCLARRFGRVDMESDLLPFGHTTYYDDEMGKGLKRKFISFEKLIPPKDAYKLKLITRRIEKRFSVAGRRRINIDPGYITLGKLVLFSTKDYTHRVYLNDGIYAEVTLFYKDKSFRPWDWTYPDYKTAEYIDFFNRVREIYNTSLRAKRSNLRDCFGAFAPRNDR